MSDVCQYSGFFFLIWLFVRNKQYSLFHKRSHDFGVKHMLLCEANNMSTIWTKMKHTVCEKSNETNWGLLICLNLIANTLLLRVWCAVCLGALAAWGLCNTACWVADFFFLPSTLFMPTQANQNTPYRFWWSSFDTKQHCAKLNHTKRNLEKETNAYHTSLKVWVFTYWLSL